jgi:predicted acyl esterase
MVPGKPESVELPLFSFFARSLKKGSRLRLVLNAGPVWGWQRNSHTGGDLATEPASKGRIATITIATGGDSGSVLELPRPKAAVLDRMTKPGQ